MANVSQPLSILYQKFQKKSSFETSENLSYVVDVLYREKNGNLLRSVVRRGTTKEVLILEFVRNLRLGDSGDDVFYIKKKLFELGYYDKSVTSIRSQTFRADTDKAVRLFQERNKDELGRPLVIDGIIGLRTWAAIEGQSEPAKKPTYSRLIREGMNGEDVRFMKDSLFALGYYDDKIKRIASNTYRGDTGQAVRKFQTEHGLAVDGIIGPATWNAVLKALGGEKPAPIPPTPTPVSELDCLVNISKANRDRIRRDLVGVSDLRKQIVLEILSYAYDHKQGGPIRGLYNFGGNLYNTNLRLNYSSIQKIEDGARRYPDFYSAGRKEWMIAELKRNPGLTGSDCSGQMVGYLRKHRLVSNTFDASANTLTGNGQSTSISKASLKPGDWVGFDGHIGTYVGGGLVVEHYGGAFGCALTELDNRRGYNHVKKTLVKGTAWSRFRRPRYY